MSDLSVESTVGKIDTHTGSLSVRCKILESGESIVYMYAFDPSDLRKAGIILSLNEVQYKGLKDLIKQTDDTIGRLQSSKSIMPANNEVIISLAGVDVRLPKDLYEETSKMVLNGETMLAAQKIQKNIQSVSLSGARDIAEAICAHLRHIGERE